MYHDFALHNYYLTRACDFSLLDRVHEATTHTPVGSIELVAVDLLSIDTMTDQDKANAWAREDAKFLFLLKGFADIDEAAMFMDALMDNVNEQE